MKQFYIVFISLLSFNSFCQIIDPESCKTSEVMKELYQTNTAAKIENENFELYTREFVKNRKMQKTSVAACYIIPVVFHVYGTTQSGKTVNNALIINALNNLNKDIHGLNADYATVHSSFLGIRDLMPDVTFALALLDPSGNPTDGIVYHPVASGFGNGSGYDAAIATDAWDNYKYMNIYVMNDLFNNSVYTNSGVAWYPSTVMSSNNTARVVYNGAYLGTNTSVEFASTLTHEIGHWLNLIHTFDGGCISPNDNVSDTPPCDYSGASYSCHSSSIATTPLNCTSNLINAENYMDYSGAYGCYKMFTQGQVARVYAALSHATRQPLWQTSNLVATGLSNLCSSLGLNSLDSYSDEMKIYPNPSNDNISIKISSSYIGLNFSILNQLGVAVLQGKLEGETTDVKIDKLTAGIYFLKIEGLTSAKKIIKQ